MLNSILVIEHTLDVMRCSGWINDLGPDGGDKGGQIVVVGTPETVAEHPTSHTGKSASNCWSSIRQRSWHAEWWSEYALVELGEGLGVSLLVAWIWKGVEGPGGDWRSSRQNGVCLVIRT
jgi:hypothetical protein